MFVVRYLIIIRKRILEFTESFPEALLLPRRCDCPVTFPIWAQDVVKLV